MSVGGLYAQPDGPRGELDRLPAQPQTRCAAGRTGGRLTDALSVEGTIRFRRSVRTYEHRPLSHEDRAAGRVVNARVGESIPDGEDRVDLGRTRPIVYDSARRAHRVVGEEVGGAWDAGKALM